MDLQDLFFQPDWRLIEMTSVVGHQAGSVYELARVQQPHAVAPGTTPYQQSSQFTYTNMHTWTAGSANWFDVCIFLLPWVACVCVSLWVPLCGYATLVWHFLPVLTSDLIQLCLSDLKCHPINYNFSPLCALSLSPLKHLLPLSLTPTLKELKTEKQQHAMKWSWVISQWEVINHLSFNKNFLMEGPGVKPG